MIKRNVMKVKFGKTYNLLLRIYVADKVSDKYILKNVICKNTIVPHSYHRAFKKKGETVRKIFEYNFNTQMETNVILGMKK